MLFKLFSDIKKNNLLNILIFIIFWIGGWMSHKNFGNLRLKQVKISLYVTHFII